VTSLCIIGAGSAEFTARIIGDLLQLDEFRRMRIVLHDIDGERLRAAENIARATSRKFARTRCGCSMSIRWRCS